MPNGSQPRAPTPTSQGKPRPDSPSAQPRNRLASVTHRSSAIDLRVVAWRPDLADMQVYGQLAAHSYVEPAPSVCRVPAAGVRSAPDTAAEQVSQLLLGEVFHLLEIGETWAWGYCGHDRYVGYVLAESLALGDASPVGSGPVGSAPVGSAPVGSAPAQAPRAQLAPTSPAPVSAAPTHWVSAPQGLVFSGPSIKTALRLTAPMGARLRLAEHDEKFFTVAGDDERIQGGGFLHRRHVRALGDWAADPASVAESLLGTPYLWGGRTRAGIDCSGLVQQALMACGIEAPRDSDQQQVLGRAVPEAEWGSLKRGDIVFFPGHVGIMADAVRLIHANAYWMSTVVEPLADVADRLRPQTDTPILCVRRL